MPRKRPTESSWDSDEDLLEDDTGLLSILSTGKELDDVDEDALLGIGSDDEFNVDPITDSQNQHVTRQERALFTSPTADAAVEDEEVIQLGVELVVDEADDLDEADVLSRIHEQHPHLAADNYYDENLQLSEARQSESETILSQDHSFSEAEVAAVSSSHPSSISYHEEHEAPPSDEDSDSDEADKMSRRRDRFRTERASSSAAALQPTAASKAEKRDIPDTLEVSQEDQQKIEQFMQNQQLRGRQRMPYVPRRPLLGRGRLPSRPFRLGQVRSPAMQRHPMFRPGIGGRVPFGVGFGRGGNMMSSGGVTPRHKILVNPHFRGTPSPSMMQGPTPRTSPASEYQKLMSMDLVRPPPQFANSGQPAFVYQNAQVENSRPFFVQQGPRAQFVHQQPPQVRQVDSQLIAHPPGSAVTHNVPSSFAQPPRTPLNHVSSLPQPSPQVITVAGPPASFPAQQPAPQSQVYSGMPMTQGIPQHQQPPSVFLNQPNFPSHTFVGQQQGMNVLRPMAGADVQPIYRNMEPLANQQPSNQTSFLLRNTGPPNQPVMLQRYPLAAGERPAFGSSAVRPPVPSIPGYMDFGAGEASQLQFKTDFSSDPEIVGQPIETVIHNRKTAARHNDSRASFGSGQARPFLATRNRYSTGGASQPQAKPLSSNLHSASEEEIEQRRKLEQRARRFAVPAPAKSQSLSSAHDVIKLGTKRPSDQGLEAGGQSAAKQMRLIASRKVVAKAKATVVQQRQSVLPLRQPQQGTLTAQLPASVAQQVSTVQRLPASQRIGVRSVQQQQQQQPSSSIKKTAAISVPRPIRPVSDEAAYDAELQSGLEAQKRLREQILRRKEMRRNMQVQERRDAYTHQPQQKQQLQQKQQSITTFDRPAALPQTHLMPTASNTVFRPRLRLSATPRTTLLAQPLVTTRPVQSLGPIVRQRTPVGARPTRPPTGIARPTVIRNAVTTPTRAVTRMVVDTPFPFDTLPRCADMLPIPRRAMAPSRIAAIMMRRQFPDDPRAMGANVTSLVPNIVVIDGTSPITTEMNIHHLAENVGPVQTVQLNRDEKCAFILFQNAKDARQFAVSFDRTMLDKSVISVSLITS